MFRQDYRAMQAAMIYGASPDFDTMISQLKILTGRFRLIEEYDVLENIIKDAEAIIDKAGSKGATFSTPVSYFTDLYKPPGPTNKTITYHVKFIWESNKWIFENITVMRINRL